MNRRILINLAAFATLGAVLVFWALQNVVKFDFIERPYRLTAEFSSSPGLHPGFEVAYLGVRVGKINSVKLESHKVVARLDIDRGVEIPRNVSAAANRKSAVGEPYIELTPAAGQGRAPALEPGAVIPMSRTSVPQTYGELFGAVNRALSAIDPEDAGTLVHELSVGWDGRSESLRELIDGGDQLTNTFADNSELIDGLTKDLTAITHTVARHRGELGEGIDDLATLSAALRDVRTELTRLRDRGPGLVDRVNRLFGKSEADYYCAIDTLGTTLPRLLTPAALQDLKRTLALAPDLVEALNGVLGTDQGQAVLNVVFVITTKQTAAVEYKSPLPQPKVAKIPACRDGRSPGLVKQRPPAKDDPSAYSQAAAARKVTQPADAVDPVKNAASETPAGPPAWLVYVPPLLALLVLIKVMAGALPLLPRRRRRP
ncbi:MCE family protein [Actinomadura sp. HBU206391]|uniref:MCE family protein n=1 Tax=Actinomadura sp. HBU206391 TaxID=2731692 RepID=UPI0016504E1F|nr:MCE family protein [Actinomadura sp. HBU206391]MBC6460079.1 MCE family protein [Actinomadura sp. HBU206391]